MLYEDLCSLCQRDVNGEGFYNEHKGWLSLPTSEGDANHWKIKLGDEL